MSTVQLKHQEQKKYSQTSIFANRNTLYHRFHQTHKLHSQTSLQKDPGNSKFQLFKSRLSKYIQSESTNQLMGTLNKATKANQIQRSYSYNHKTFSSEEADEKIKMSFVKYLRAASNQLKHEEKEERQKKLSKIRIHTNLGQKYLRSKNANNDCQIVKKRSYTQDLQQKEPTIQQSHSVPICTINFYNSRGTQVHPKTIYNSYLQDKLGLSYSEDHENSHQQFQNDKAKNLSPNKMKNYSSINIQTSQVFILDRTTNVTQIELLEKQKSELLKSRKRERFRANKQSIGLNVKINRAKEIDNLVGPWSKNPGIEEEEEEYLKHK